MGVGMTAVRRRIGRGHAAAPLVPTQRESPENATRNRHRAPSLGELIDETMASIRHGKLAPSGYVVVQSKGAAKHHHAVWQLGPFALLNDGWFGQVHGLDRASESPSRWLRRHERRCRAEHWTHFAWIDPAVIQNGCGSANTGIGLGPDGPTYCSGRVPGTTEHAPHVPLEQILQAGLRELTQRRR
ncbi:MAG: hypothetical protein JWP74_2430 [Marmoricola sp.]|nr:hypothetical protein [Marmoricola sp.]